MGKQRGFETTHEKIFVCRMSDKGLMSKVYKECV